jgi:hypothetical protein
VLPHHRERQHGAAEKPAGRPRAEGAHIVPDRF